MSKHSSQKKRIVILALFNRYAYTILFPLLIILIFRKNMVFLLFGADFILMALHSLIGYICRWKHIYCSYQNVHRKQMTPNNICWAKIKKGEAYGSPAIEATIGIALIIFSFVYKF
ncbi:MAG: hypothetical protein IJN49_03600 [Clostridia bacterium]|nr:hypothetical protein [Clostridia bacterium]